MKLYADTQALQKKMDETGRRIDYLLEQLRKRNKQKRESKQTNHADTDKKTIG